MEIHQAADLDVPLSKVWEALNDPNMLKLCVPGCEEVKVIDDSTYAARAVVKVGFISAKFDNIRVKKTKSVEGELLAFELSGEDANRVGSFKQNLEIRISEGSGGAQSTHLEVIAAVDLKGKFATLGKRIVEWKAKGIIEDFVKNLRGHVK